MLTKHGDAIKVPIIVRFTNAAIAKELIDNSGMPILSAVEFQLTKLKQHFLNYKYSYI
jgi:hypothetical protein